MDSTHRKFSASHELAFFHQHLDSNWKKTKVIGTQTLDIVVDGHSWISELVHDDTLALATYCVPTIAYTSCFSVQKDDRSTITSSSIVITGSGTAEHHRS